MRPLTGSILLLSLALSACGDGGDEASEPGLVGRTFLSESATVDGEPFDLVAGTRVQLSFDAGQLSAQAGCNTLGGAFRFDGDRIVVAALGGTEIGCEPALHAQDEWLAGLLQAGPRFAVDGDRLRLETADTVLELVDRETADPDRPLEGTTWSLDGVISGEAVGTAPSPATVRFADGQVLVQIPECNGGSGAAAVDAAAGTVEIEPIVRTMMACPEGPAATEAAVFGVLEGTVAFEIEAGTLTLRHPSGSGLLLRAA